MSGTEVVYDYVEEIDPNLTCSICQSALVDPVTTTSCKHTFCRDCITTALSHNPQCPIDRSALTLRSLRDTEQLVKLMLDELKVKCAAEGCEEVMQRGLLLAHSRSCVKGLVRCDDPECGLSMARQRLPHHRAYECFQRKMECEKCNVVLTFKARSQHNAPDSTNDREECGLCGEALGVDKKLHAWSCSQGKVPCTHASRGCGAIIIRSKLEDHTRSCPFEAMSSFFAINDARFAAVEERSKGLAQTVETLNAELGIVKTELAYAQTSIEYMRKMIRDGWVNNMSPPLDDPPTGDLLFPPTAPSGATPREDDPTTPMNRPVDLPGIDETRQSPANPTRQPATPPRTAPPESSPAAEPGFPAWAGITDRAAADIQARQRPLIPAANIFAPTETRRRRTYADQVFDRLPPGMSGEQAIRSLMGVTAHLANGMDSMERRNEIRSMTDGLRVSEEVAGLRAIVNTMRIQVMMNQQPHSHRPMPIPSRPFSPRFSTGPQPIPPTINSTTTQITRAPSPGSPPSSAPFSSYVAPGSIFAHRSPDTEPIPLEDDEYDDPERPRHGVRESVMFRANRASTGSTSTSSLVSTGAGRVVGRPMGIPPPEAEVGRAGNESGRGSLRLRTNPISLLSRRLTQRENGPRL